VSLIFEALKKLDREKQVQERGVVVVAQAPWPASRRRGLVWVVMGAGLVLVVGLASFLVLRQAGGSSAPASPRPAATATTPVATVLAAPAEIASPPPRAPVRPTPAQNAPVWQRPTAATERPAMPQVAAPPTQALAPTPAPRSTPIKEDLQLQAITERDGQPVAMVSGRLVREGDSFDGVRILKIGPTEVEIEVDGRRRVLRF
jgi:hypothetical protein